MKWRQKFAWILLLAVWASGAWSAPTLHIGPYLQNLGQTAVTVMWETTEAVVGEVEVQAGGQPTRRVADREAVTLHEVRVTGLTPGTRYTYRVRWPGVTSEAYTFRTAPMASTSRFRLVVYGDSRSNPDMHAEIAKRIAGEKPDLVLHTGDLVADGRQKEQWKPQFFDPAAPFMRTVCLFPVLGNHERNAEHYYRYFSLPGNEAWYAFNYANARFIGLDTQQPCEPGSEQYQWLVKELQRQRQEWTIVFLHAPPFSVHPTRPVSRLRWVLQPLFQQYGVDMTFAGHDHHYARCHPVGPAFGPGRPVRHFITGGGGASLYPVEDKPWSAVVNKVNNYMVVNFDGSRVSGVAKDREGKTIDTFAFDRRAPVPAKDLFAWEVVLWERALNEAFREQVSKLIKPTSTEVDVTLRLPAPPFGNVSGELQWEVGPDSPWQFANVKAPFSTGAGGTLVVPLQGRCTRGKALPLPGATLRIKDGQPAWRCRNTSVRLLPYEGEKS